MDPPDLLRVSRLLGTANGRGPLFKPFGNHFSLPNFGGGYSNVLSFAEGGATPLELLHALKLTENVHPEIQFENA